jgi:hypothetical protein
VENLDSKYFAWYLKDEFILNPKYGSCGKLKDVDVIGTDRRSPAFNHRHFVAKKGETFYFPYVDVNGNKGREEWWSFELYGGPKFSIPASTLWVTHSGKEERRKMRGNEPLLVEFDKLPEWRKEKIKKNQGLFWDRIDFEKRGRKYGPPRFKGGNICGYDRNKKFKS